MLTSIFIVPALKNYPLTRLQSSGGPVTEQEPKKKKRLQKPKYAKYVELLEVTDTNSQHKRARVKLMKAKQLQDFITKSIIAKRVRQNAKTVRKNVDTDETVASVLKNRPVPFFDEDRPVIFCENESVSNRLTMSAKDIDSILKSFTNFKEAVEITESGDLLTSHGLMDIE